MFNATKLNQHNIIICILLTNVQYQLTQSSAAHVHASNTDLFLASQACSRKVAVQLAEVAFQLAEVAVQLAEVAVQLAEVAV